MMPDSNIFGGPPTTSLPSAPPATDSPTNLPITEVGGGDGTDTMSRIPALPKVAEAMTKAHSKELLAPGVDFFVFLLNNVLVLILTFFGMSSKKESRTFLYRKPTKCPVERCKSIDTTQVAAKVESIKKWTIGTFRNSKQQLLEHMGKVDKTVDPEFEDKCNSLKEIHKRYGLVVSAAKNFSNTLAQMVEAEKKFSESFYQLSLKEEQLKNHCTKTSETMSGVGEQAAALESCLKYFISSMETVYTQSITDTLHTIYHTETARIEYDVDRNELSALQNSPNGAKPIPPGATEKCEDKRAKYEKLKEDVKVKMQLLEENRIGVVCQQLEKLQRALAAYYSGNAKLLEASVREIESMQKRETSFIAQ